MGGCVNLKIYEIYEIELTLASKLSVLSLSSKQYRIHGSRSGKLK